MFKAGFFKQFFFDEKIGGLLVELRRTNNPSSLTFDHENFV